MQVAEHNDKIAQYQYTHKRTADQKRRLFERSDSFRDTCPWRADIEAAMSRLKYQINMANLRIRGMEDMHYFVHLRALGSISAVTALPAHRARQQQ